MTNRQWNPGNIDRVENLTYMPLERNYLKVMFLKTGSAYVCMMLLPLFLLLAEGLDCKGTILFCTESALLTAAVLNLSLLPRSFSNKGFAIREHDITYRSGIIFRSSVTIPFCKIQQVSIGQNPFTRIFGLYTVDIVNGAQFLAGTAIPGLTEEKAEEIKAFIIERTKNEND